MAQWLTKYAPNVVQFADVLEKAVWDTLEMMVKGGGYSFILGLIFGTILVVTRKGGLSENKIVNGIISFFVNFLRALPFVILIGLLKPLTRAISGTTIEVRGIIFPLVVGCTPFFIRQVELALSEVDSGLIEAAQAMGLSKFEIVTKVYLRESIPSLARSVTITLISLLGLTAMAGAVGAGGIGDAVLKFGYNRNMPDITYFCVIVILIIVIIIQFTGNFVIKKATH